MPTTVEEVEKLSWASFSTWPGKTLTSFGINRTSSRPLSP